MSFITNPFTSFTQWMKSVPAKKGIYFLHEGSTSDDQLLSPKFANLCECARNNVTTAPAFILIEENSSSYFSEGCKATISESLARDICPAIAELERQTGKAFGASSGSFPLVVCVRAGAPVQQMCLGVDEVSLFEEQQRLSSMLGMRGAPESLSFPGLQETVLGIGLNDAICDHLGSLTSTRYALNAYANFLLRFGTAVLKADVTRYYKVITDVVTAKGRKTPFLGSDDLRHLIREFKAIQEVPDDVRTQLHMAISAVYNCWYTDKAIRFRNDVLNLPRGQEVAVCVQAMIFGGSGTCFSRNPITGEPSIIGEFWGTNGIKVNLMELEKVDPQSVRELRTYAQLLERHFRDIQDIEFVVEDGGRVFIVQTRPARRTPKASMKIAVQMVEERLITEREALLRIDAIKCVPYFSYEQVPNAPSRGAIFDLFPPTASSAPSSGEDSSTSLQPPRSGSSGATPFASAAPFCKGIAASQGAMNGVLALSSEECLEMSLGGDVKVILCTDDCAAIDSHAIKAAAGVMTLRGNLVSDTALLCRSLAKPCVTAVHDAHISIGTLCPTGVSHGKAEAKEEAPESVSDQSGDTASMKKSKIASTAEASSTTGGPFFSTGRSARTALVCDCGEVLHSGDRVTLDGTNGRLYSGYLHTETAFNDVDFRKVLGWADKFRRTKVYAAIPAHYRDQAQDALMMEADGLGSINTDRMFSSSEHRLTLTRAVLFSKTPQEMTASLTLLEGLHRENFRGIFRAAQGLPVCVQLLDESLHVLMPQTWHEAAEVAAHMNLSVSDVKASMSRLRENNPSMGLRGCRLSAVLPAITTMQVNAIMQAAIDVTMEGYIVNPNIVIPMATCDHELYEVLETIHSAAKQVVDKRCNVKQSDSASASESREQVPRDKVPRYSVGAVLGTPRSCLRAESIAQVVAFVTINTDLLTQQVYGCSRDDASKFLPHYLREGIYQEDPFRSIDEKAVGFLMKSAIASCRKTNPMIQCGVVGAHTADPKSLHFFHSLGVDSICCSALTVPVAKICSAQARIREDRDENDSSKSDWKFPFFDRGVLEEDGGLIDEWGNGVVLF